MSVNRTSALTGLVGSLRSWRDFFGGCFSGGAAISSWAKPARNFRERRSRERKLAIQKTLVLEQAGFQLDSSPFFSRRGAFFPPNAFETSELTRENSASYAG